MSGGQPTLSEVCESIERLDARLEEIDRRLAEFETRQTELNQWQAERSGLEVKVLEEIAKRLNYIENIGADWKPE